MAIVGALVGAAVQLLVGGWRSILTPPEPRLALVGPESEIEAQAGALPTVWGTALLTPRVVTVWASVNEEAVSGPVTWWPGRIALTANVLLALCEAPTDEVYIQSIDALMPGGWVSLVTSGPGWRWTGSPTPLADTGDVIDVWGGGGSASGSGGATDYDIAGGRAWLGQGDQTLADIVDDVMPTGWPGSLGTGIGWRTAMLRLTGADDATAPGGGSNPLYGRGFLHGFDRRSIAEIGVWVSRLTGPGELIPVTCQTADGAMTLLGATPDGVIREILTDTQVGLGLAPSEIYTASLSSSAATWVTEHAGICLAQHGPVTAEALLSALLDSLGAILYERAQSGQIALRVLRHDDPAVTTIVEMHQRAVRVSVAPPAYSGLRATYWSPPHRGEVTRIVRDPTQPASAQLVPVTITGVTGDEGVARALARLLTRHCRETVAVEAEILPSVAWGLQPGYVVTMTLPGPWGGPQRVRVAEIRWPASDSWPTLIGQLVTEVADWLPLVPEPAP